MPPLDTRPAAAAVDPLGWTGHVIVCGLHGVGLRTVEQLRLAGVRVVVVDDDPDARLVRVVAGWGIPRLAADSRLPETLQDAGIAGAAAVVCVESDDLHTLETALLAHELRPDVRVVVQLANPAVGRAVTEVTGPGSVLSVADLAAPSVVEACVRRDVHPLDLDGVQVVAAVVDAPASGTLRSLYGDLVPVAVQHAVTGPDDPDGGVVVCPGRDHPVAAGDQVTLLGAPAELDAAGLRWGTAREAHRLPEPVLRAGRVWAGDLREDRPDRPAARSLRYLAAVVAGAVDRRVRLAVGVLALLVATSTVVLELGYREEGTASGQGGMSLLDALYFTVETIGTVGYGDFSFRDQPSWLRIFAIGLMILGASLATVFFALLTNVLVGNRIADQLGRRRVPGMRGHVVVAGVGAVGVRVVEGLLAQHRQVVVVERNEDNRYLAQIRALGVPVVVGDATLPATLAAANLTAAGAVAVLTSDDLTNIEAGLAVRDALGPRWREVPVVLRLFDRRLADTVERSFGFTHVRSTAALAAPWFVGAALGLHVLGTFYVGGRPLLAGRLTVPPGGALAGLAMRELGATIRVVAIRRAGSGTTAGAFQHTPRRDTRLAAGDTAYLVGPYEELITLLRR